MSVAVRVKAPRGVSFCGPPGIFLVHLLQTLDALLDRVQTSITNLSDVAFFEMDFNSLSYHFFCYDADGDPVELQIATVTLTPEEKDCVKKAMHIMLSMVTAAVGPCDWVEDGFILRRKIRQIENIYFHVDIDEYHPSKPATERVVVVPLSGPVQHTVFSPNEDHCSSHTELRSDNETCLSQVLGSFSYFSDNMCHSEPLWRGTRTVMIGRFDVQTLPHPRSEVAALRVFTGGHGSSGAMDTWLNPWHYARDPTYRARLKTT